MNKCAVEANIIRPQNLHKFIDAQLVGCGDSTHRCRVSGTGCLFRPTLKAVFDITLILQRKVSSAPLQGSRLGEAETEGLRPDKNCRGCPWFINRQILISGYLRETAAKIKTLFPDVFH